MGRDGKSKVFASCYITARASYQRSISLAVLLALLLAMHEHCLTVSANQNLAGPAPHSSPSRPAVRDLSTCIASVIGRSHLIGASADKSLNGDAAVRPLVCVWIHDGSAMSDGTGWELGGGDGLFLEQFAIMGAEVSTAGAWVAQGGGAQEAIVLLLEWLGDEHEVHWSVSAGWLSI